MLFFVFCWLFFKYSFQKQYLRNVISAKLNCLDPDQVQHILGPDWGPNCFQSDQQTSLTVKVKSVNSLKIEY